MAILWSLSYSSLVFFHSALWELWPLSWLIAFTTAFAEFCWRPKLCPFGVAVGVKIWDEILQERLPQRTHARWSRCPLYGIALPPFSLILLVGAIAKGSTTPRNQLTHLTIAQKLLLFQVQGFPQKLYSIPPQKKLRSSSSRLHILQSSPNVWAIFPFFVLRLTSLPRGRAFQGQATQDHLAQDLEFASGVSKRTFHQHIFKWCLTMIIVDL